MKNKNYDYNKAFASYYKWQVIGGVAFMATSFIMGAMFGILKIDAETAIAAAVVSALIVMIIAYIVGMIKMAKEWPTGEVNGFWSGFKVVVLNFALLGYREVPIKELPWKAVFTWGIIAVAASPQLVNYLIVGQVQEYIVTMVMSIMVMPVVIVLMYSIGRAIRLVIK